MTATTVADRTRIALLQKVDGLSVELQSWREQSRARGRFNKHCTQISRLVVQISGFLSALRSQLDRGPAQNLGRLDQVILEGHRVWDFFRRKLLLRAMNDFQLPLAIADELAWTCYRPARDSARTTTRNVQDWREPPLVFFDDDCTPFVITRGRHYASELPRPVDDDILRLMVHSLPVPVVGIPWSHARHLPEMLAIAHEVGHIVQDDFSLSPDVDSAIAAACEDAALPAREIAQWHRWSRELFADVYACAAAGPAYADTLADLLEYATGDSDLYPPRAVRLGVNAAALRCCGFDVHLPGAAESDAVCQIAAALITGPYPVFGPEASLQSITCFSADDYARAQQHATELLQRHATVPCDVRVLLSAARIAFATDPEKYRHAEIHDFAIGLGPHVLDPGVRSAGPAGTKRHDRDVERGRQLFQHVWETMAAREEA